MLFTIWTRRTRSTIRSASLSTLTIIHSYDHPVDGSLLVSVHCVRPKASPRCCLHALLLQRRENKSGGLSTKLNPKMEINSVGVVCLQLEQEPFASVSIFLFLFTVFNALHGLLLLRTLLPCPPTPPPTTRPKRLLLLLPMLLHAGRNEPLASANNSLSSPRPIPTASATIII